MFQKKPGIRSYKDSKTEELFAGLSASLIKIDADNYSAILYEKYQKAPVKFGEELLGETYTDDMKALMDSVRDNRITVAISGNAVGKTFSAARIAIWWYKCFPGAQVYTAAAPPESNLKKLLWGEIGSLCDKHKQIFEPDTSTILHISRSPQSFVTGVTIPSSGTEAQREARFSGKHSPYLMFLVDEGDAVPDEVFRGIDSCMSSANSRLLVMFNPRAEQGEVYRMIRDGRANVVHLSAFNHPNVMTGRDVIPGAVSRETTVRRINEWCRPLKADENKDSECFELPKFLVGATSNAEGGTAYTALRSGYYKIMEPAFSYMVLGQYPGQGTMQLIAREWINRARARWDAYVADRGELPPEHTRPVQGLDVGEYDQDENCLISRYGGFVARPVFWTGLDLAETEDRTLKEYHKVGATVVNVDGTGVGAGVSSHLSKQRCTAISVKVASAPTDKCELGEFRILRDQLAWNCREWLRTDPGAMLPPDELLIEELSCPTYVVDGGKVMVMQKKVMRQRLKRSPNRMDALFLTFYQAGLFAGLDLS